MFGDLGRLVAEARVEVEQKSGKNKPDGNMIPEWVVVNILNRIESHIGLTERQVLESLSTTNKTENSSASQNISPEAMYEAAVEAINHMAQANWAGRDSAARIWLVRILKGDTSMTLDEIQREVNNE